jgi:hypothetical protein
VGFQLIDFQVESGLGGADQRANDGVGVTLRNRIPTSVKRLTGTPEK